MSDFLKIIAEDLDLFNLKFKNVLSTKASLLHKVTTYLSNSNGKKIRPICTIIAAGLANSVTEKTYRGAILIELLHTATLIHDDIVDDAQLRRSRLSINAIWKNKIAVLSGDYFLAKGLKLAVIHKDFEFLQLISNVVEQIVEGELLQIEKTRKLNLTEKDYFKIIKLKTASLFETSFHIGSVSADADLETNQMLLKLGEKIGLLFQIKDDVIDYDTKLLNSGKKSGNDIQEGKINLPLLYSLKKMNTIEKNEVYRALRRTKNTKSELIRVQNLVIKYNGIDQAELKIKQYSQEAQSLLSHFSSSRYKDAMLLLLNFLTNRSK